MALPGPQSLLRALPCDSAQEMTGLLQLLMLLGSKEFDVLGISYFGNEHTSVPMNEPRRVKALAVVKSTLTWRLGLQVNLHRQKWNAVFHHLRSSVAMDAPRDEGGPDLCFCFSFGPTQTSGILWMPPS